VTAYSVFSEGSYLGGLGFHQPIYRRTLSSTCEKKNRLELQLVSSSSGASMLHLMDLFRPAFN